MSAPILGRSGPPLFAVAAFWAFVLGGIAFGVMFVANWRVLAARAPEQRGVPTGVVTVAAGRMSVTMPVTINPAPSTSAGSRPQPSIEVNIASVVTTVLPD